MKSKGCDWTPHTSCATAINRRVTTIDRGLTHHHHLSLRRACSGLGFMPIFSSRRRSLPKSPMFVVAFRGYRARPVYRQDRTKILTSATRSAQVPITPVVQGAKDSRKPDELHRKMMICRLSNPSLRKPGEKSELMRRREFHARKRKPPRVASRDRAGGRETGFPTTPKERFSGSSESREVEAAQVIGRRAPLVVTEVFALRSPRLQRGAGRWDPHLMPSRD